MTQYETWLVNAYDRDGQAIPAFWETYLPLEQKIYEKLLTNKTTHLEGTPEQLAQDFKMEVPSVYGFLDGISEVNTNTIDLKELEPTTKVAVDFTFANLFKKMVEYKAEHLYTLAQWNNIFTDDEQKELYKEQRRSTTVTKETKPERNAPCPCGSGKKYKKCCGA